MSDIRPPNDRSPDDPAYRQAKQHVAALKGFYVHAFIFTSVNAGLFAINVVTKTGWWFHWPLLGWGIGLIGHAVAVFMPINLLGKDWEERRIKQVMTERAAQKPNS